MTSKVSVLSVFIAIAAGFASALAFASLIGGSPMALPVFAGAPLPLMVAGLAFGPVAAAIGGGVAIVTLQLGFGTPAALFELGAMAVPAVVLTHLAGRSTTVGGVERWYPIGALVTATAVLMAVATLAGAVAIGFDVEATTREVVAQFRHALAEGGTAPADLPEAVSLEPFVRASVRLMPAFFPAFWTLVLMLDLAIAARLARRLAGFARPVEDVAMMTPPLAVGMVFAAGFAGAFLPGSLGILAAIAAGAAFAPLFLVGMGVLTVVTRGSDMRWILRATAYGLVLLFPIAALVMALVGLTDSFVSLRRGRPGATD